MYIHSEVEGTALEPEQRSFLQQGTVTEFRNLRIGLCMERELVPSFGKGTGTPFHFFRNAYTSDCTF